GGAEMARLSGRRTARCGGVVCGEGARREVLARGCCARRAAARARPRRRTNESVAAREAWRAFVCCIGDTREHVVERGLGFAFGEAGRLIGAVEYLRPTFAARVAGDPGGGG